MRDGCFGCGFAGAIDRDYWVDAATPVALKKAGVIGGNFNQAGTFLVMVTTGTGEGYFTRYFHQVVFSGGSATISWNNFSFAE